MSMPLGTGTLSATTKLGLHEEGTISLTFKIGQVDNTPLKG